MSRLVSLGPRAGTPSQRALGRSRRRLSIESPGLNARRARDTVGGLFVVSRDGIAGGESAGPLRAPREARLECLDADMVSRREEFKPPRFLSHASGYRRLNGCSPIHPARHASPPQASA